MMKRALLLERLKYISFELVYQVDTLKYKLRVRVRVRVRES